jgi:hypothetical protein
MGAHEKYAGLRVMILQNEQAVGTPSYKTVVQIAEHFGTTPAYVYRVRYLLGMKDTPMKLQSSHVKLETATDEEGSLKDLLNEPLISPLDRLKILSRLMRVGAPSVKIQAIKAYEELTRTSEGRIGPGPPLTDEDRIARLARLLMALPATLTSQSWEIAYGYAPTTAPDRSTLQAPSGSLPLPASPSPEPLYDLPIPSNRPASPRDRPLPSDGPSPGPTL